MIAGAPRPADSGRGVFERGTNRPLPALLAVQQQLVSSRVNLF